MVKKSAQKHKKWDKQKCYGALIDRKDGTLERPHHTPGFLPKSAELLENKGLSFWRMKKKQRSAEECERKQDKFGQEGAARKEKEFSSETLRRFIAPL